MSRVWAVALLAACSLAPVFGSGRPEVSQFEINGFVVSIDAASVSRDARPPRRTERSVSGTGHIMVRGQVLPVAYSGVELQPAANTPVPVATAGLVQGRSDGSAAAPRTEYRIHGHDVRVDIMSLRITPETAHASVSLTLRLDRSFAEPRATVSLGSPHCAIAADGSISADNFMSRGSVRLAESVYTMTLSGRQTVKLQSMDERRPGFRPVPWPAAGSSHIDLRGVASRYDIGIFAVRATIRPALQQTRITMTLRRPVDSTPVPGYELTLHSGRVEYEYGQEGRLVSCSGSLVADVALPARIVSEHGDRVRLEGIVLKTNADGELFGNVTVDSRLRIGYEDPATSKRSILLVEPLEESSLIYFREWVPGRTGSIYGSVVKETAPCEELLEHLEGTGPMTGGEMLANTSRRSGLTIMRGTLYLRAPQTTAPGMHDGSWYNLKSQFWGNLTCTPWGLTGRLTTSGASFVSADAPITEAGVRFAAAQLTLDDIIAFGNDRPQIVRSRFYLNGFQVLQMRIDSMEICRNRLWTSRFRYTIHFPFPTYLDLEFEDTSLDSHGFFVVAHGPVSPLTYELESHLTAADMALLLREPPKGTTVRRNSVSQVIFAWRLPVCFSHHGVRIDHTGRTGEAGAQVLLGTAEDDAAIESSEVSVSPLYSINSALTFGVRFSGFIGSDGEFELQDFDRNVVFAPTYPVIGPPEQIGFPVRLDNVNLAPDLSDPASREYDFRWAGAIQFALFGLQDADFLVKNVVPHKALPVTLTGYGQKGDGSEALTVSVEALHYDAARLVPFTSDQVSAQSESPPGSTGTRLHARSIEMTSYLSGRIVLEGNNGPGLPDSLPEGAVLTDAVYSDAFRDLICYDEHALQDFPDHEGFLGCSEETDYWIGTLEVRDADGRVVMSAPRTKWRSAQPDHFEMDGSPVQFNAEDDPDGDYSPLINIPSARIAYNAAGMIQGEFNVTYLLAGMSLPYQGAVRFLVDPKPGHFYLQITGTFTSFVRFRGQVFLVHLPYKHLRNSEPYPSILDDISIRALFPSPDELIETLQLDDAQPDTLVSGFLVAGNAQFGTSILRNLVLLDIASGPGLYVLRRKDAQDSEISAGMFMNTAINANLLILSMSTYVRLRGTYRAGAVELVGDCNLFGCANAFLFHCAAEARGRLAFSSLTGFDFSGSEASAGCATGGCP